jgi:uncharacterized membrane protein YbhN (UPF0104 family)
VESLARALRLLGGVPVAYLLVAAGLYAVSVVFAGARWRTLLAGLGSRVGLGYLSLNVLAAIFVSNVTPGRVGGEVLRVALLRQKGVDVKRATISLAYDHLLNAVPISLLVCLALPTLRRLTHRLDGWLVGILVAGTAFLAALVIYRLTPRLRAWVDGWQERFRAARIPRPRLLAALGWSAAIWAQDLARLAVVAAAFGVKLDVFQLAVLAVVSVVGGLVPTIGGLGAIEGGMTAALVFFGVPTELAIAITLFERAISYVLSTCAGGLALLALGGNKLWSLRRRPVDESA